MRLQLVLLATFGLFMAACGGNVSTVLNSQPTGSSPKENGKTPGDAGHIQGKISGTAAVYSLAMPPDGKSLATGLSDGTIALWDISTGKETKTLKGHTKKVTSLAFSGDGQVLVSCSEDKTVKLWNIADAKERCTFKGHDGLNLWVAITPDGKTVACLGTKELVYQARIWDVAKETEKATHPCRGLPSVVALTADGDHFIDGQGTMIVREISTGKDVRSMDAHKRGVKSIAISADGKTVVSGDYDGQVIVWELATAKVISSFKVSDSPQENVAITGDGKRVVTGGLHNRVKLWDAASGSLLAAGPKAVVSADHVAITADGKKLVNCDSGDLHIWETEAFIKANPKDKE